MPYRGRVTSPRLRLLAGAAAFAAAFAAVYLVAVCTAWGQTVDAWMFGSVQPGPGPVESAAHVLRPGLPLVLALACLPCGVGALRSRRWRPLAAAAMVVVVSVPVSRALREVVLGRPFFGEHAYLQNTLPSGHVTIAAALLVALVLLMPRGRRRLATAVAAIALPAACCASVVGHAHRPSDVVASLLLVGAVACAVLAALGPTGQPPRRPTR